MKEFNPLPIAGPRSVNPGALIHLVREEARRLLAEAFDAEVVPWIDAHAHLKNMGG